MAYYFDKTLVISNKRNKFILPESNNGVLFADIALGLMFGSLGGSEAVEYRQPHHGLWLLLQPLQEVESLDELHLAFSIALQRLIFGFFLILILVLVLFLFFIFILILIFVWK